MATLHPLERKVLESLSNREWKDVRSLSISSGLKEDQVRRAVEWLLQKGFVEKHEVKHTQMQIKDKPAELKLVEILKSSGGTLSLEQLRSVLSQEELSAGMGKARANKWIEVKGDGEASVRLTGTDYSIYFSSFERISAGKELSAFDLKYLEDLSRRGLVQIKEHRSVEYRITEHGLAALSSQHEEYLEGLTAELLASGAWKGKKLRPIDVKADAPRFYPGRRHPVREFISEVRDVYISMGFTELHGGSIQPAFWNFDALFIPQDHPAREMQDTFYLEDLQDEAIRREGVYERVALTHENGWVTGGTGWGYRWDVNQAKKLLLRTHNTVLTVKALHEYGNRELRVFAISKVYRNESLDYKHLAEFHQMDGIIAGKNLNIKHLVGFLKEFYRKLGIKDVKLWPTYFPYTEPSLQIMGYSEKAGGWIELGGSGIFRPEVTIPLGVDLPVLAWGPAIERLMLLRYNLNDIRELYSNDIGWLRRRRQFASGEG